MDDYTFRVPVPEHLPQMHFASWSPRRNTPARAYGPRVWSPGTLTAWRMIWRDGEIVSTGARGAVLVPYRVEGV